MPPPSAKRAQSITFKQVSPRVYRDPDFRLDASATSGLDVSFTATGDCTVDGSTVHVLSSSDLQVEFSASGPRSIVGSYVRMAALGKCLVTADQPGNGNFNPAPSVKRTLEIIFQPGPPR